MTTVRVIICAAVLSVAFLPTPRADDPAHFSNRRDKEADGNGCLLDGSNLGQILYTQVPDVAGPPYPENSFDLVPVGNVDALAWHSALIDEIVAGGGELLISFEGDYGNIAVYYERIIERDTLWSQADFARDCGSSGLDDLDALSIHGPRNAGSGYFYSVEGDAAGTSIYYSTGGGSNVYITQGEVLTALTSLSPAFSGTESQVDIDAFMIKDGAPNGQFGTGDTILFSIAPAANFHGGELIHLAYGGMPDFLTHGGNRWDPTFDPRGVFGIPLGPKNADAVDSKQREPTKFPMLSGLAMILLVVLLLLIGVAALRKQRRRLAT